ncbi:hypothetical protein QT970_23320 [Microcoleus sp. herbarium8]|uniref:hypothetical protein n=1 Tax=Microcoleus sp. herbarium8 TaxID=3055436 RepID=UPI002FD1DD29
MENHQKIDKNFHNVDPDSLKITVDEILSGGGVEVEEMDYTVAVPTANGAKLHGKRFNAKSGAIVDTAPRSPLAEKRGTLGGC